MSVRQATIEDAEAIGLVHVRAWQAAYRAEIPAAFLDALDPADGAERWTRILQESSGTVFVAEHEAQVVGFCALSASRDGDADPGTVAEITALYVHPDHWRAGHGSALCDAALESARRQGFGELTLWVLRNNARAQGLYRDQGLRADGASKTTPHDSGAVLDEVRFRIRLSEAG